MKEIILACGAKTKVSDEDYVFLLGYSWHKNKDGYAVFNKWENRKCVTCYMNRVVAERADFNIVGMIVDHKNNDRLDNQRENLVPTTHLGNMQHKRLYKNNTSGYPGVHRDQDKWRAVYKTNNQRLLLGRFDNFEEAVAARKAAEEKYGGPGEDHAT